MKRWGVRTKGHYKVKACIISNLNNSYYFLWYNQIDISLDLYQVVLIMYRVYQDQSGCPVHCSARLKVWTHCQYQLGQYGRTVLSKYGSKGVSSENNIAWHVGVASVSYELPSFLQITIRVFELFKKYVVGSLSSTIDHLAGVPIFRLALMWIKCLRVLDKCSD